MQVPRRSIFRERAIQHYVRGREKDVLPRVVSPLVFRFLWILLALCLVGGFLAWAIRIPVFTPAVGAIMTSSQTEQSFALLFATPDQLHALHAGEPVQLQIGTASSTRLTITTVAPTVLSPEEVRQHYHLDGPLALLVSGPSVVLEVALNASLPTSQAAGSLVRAQIQVGQASLLSFLPLVGQWFRA
jgi:hypothetical protein